MTLDLNHLQARLHAYLGNHPRWAGTQPAPLRFLARGWESEIYLQDFDNSEPIVLRLYPAAGSEAKAAREHLALVKLHQAGYPVPDVYAHETQGSVLEKPFLLMEYIRGEQMWPAIGRLSGEDARSLLRQFARLLADLHRLDWRQFTRERPASPQAWVAGWLDWTRRELEHFNLPGFQPALEWLTERLGDVAPREPSPVHWDFHPGNVLLRPDSGAAVVDWTQFTVTDPRFDLAWTLLLLGAYEDNLWRKTVLAEYEQQSGEPVQALAWFDAAVATKRLGSMVVALTASPEATGMMSSAADVMRSHFPAYRWIYTLFRERTRLRLADVEAILES